MGNVKFRKFLRSYSPDVWDLRRWLDRFGESALQFIDMLIFSPRPFYSRIISSIFEMGDELVYSLTVNLEIASSLDNRLFSYPLSDDPLNVPIR
jgi:hypothetical protein